MSGGAGRAVARGARGAAAARPPPLARALRDLARGARMTTLWGRLGWQDVRRRYRRTALGPWWITISTGLTVALLATLYGGLFRLPVEGHLPHVAAGLVVWVLLSGLVTEGCAVFVQARGIVLHINLPLALHGPGFEEAAVARACAGFAHPLTVLRIGAERPLGAVLNAATAAAAGALLAKMDDDDVYGAEHLWDLVLAHEYSGAALVGKFPATVYLAARHRTVRRRRVRSETWSRSITGGAMLVARAALERAGGWRALPRHVDAVLVNDVARVGGGVYRTHDAGYVLVRHGEGHTWQADDAEFLAGAEAVEPGWRPALAGLKGAAPPFPDPAAAARAA